MRRSRRQLTQTTLDTFFHRTPARSATVASSSSSNTFSLVPSPTLVIQRAAKSAGRSPTSPPRAQGKRQRSPSPPGNKTLSPSTSSSSSTPRSRAASVVSLSSTASSTLTYGSVASNLSSRSPTPMTEPAAYSRLRAPTPEPLPSTLHDHATLLSASAPTKAKKEADEALRYGERSVILPWSDRNIMYDTDAGGYKPAWPMLEELLTQSYPDSSVKLCGLLQALLVHTPMEETYRKYSFASLRYVVDVMFTPAERHTFLTLVLPWMKVLVCNGPQLFEERRLHLLRQGENKRVFLDDLEAVTLLSCGFFSLFPGRSASDRRSPWTSGRFDRRGAGGGGSGGDAKALGISALLAPFNFDGLLSLPQKQGGGGSTSHLHKIRCLLEYFHQVYTRTVAAPDSQRQRCLEFNRVSYKAFPDFTRSQQPLQPMVLCTEGLIEEDHTALQADFANKVVGGGVLGHGCVQEEIRFVISPELLLSRLLCETLLDTEAVYMSGSTQFATYEGYARTFMYAGGTCGGATRAVPSRPSPIRHPTDGHRLLVRSTCVVAMDAVNFHSYGRDPEDQYLSSWVMREVVKAFVSFYGTSARRAVLPSVREGPIATGNWGCGAFGGDVELKLLVQWCAASEAGRVMRYYVFDRKELPAAFVPVEERLRREGWTVGQLFMALVQYSVARADAIAAGHIPQSVFEFVRSVPLNQLHPVQ